MHAVVTTITVDDPEAAPIQMREDVVPGVAQAPGFVAGYWDRGEPTATGLSMVIFESEEAAQDREREAALADR